MPRATILVCVCCAQCYPRIASAVGVQARACACSRDSDSEDLAPMAPPPAARLWTMLAAAVGAAISGSHRGSASGSAGPRNPVHMSRVATAKLFSSLHCPWTALCVDAFHPGALRQRPRGQWASQTSRTKIPRPRLCSLTQFWTMSSSSGFLSKSQSPESVANGPSWRCTRRARAAAR